MLAYVCYSTMFLVLVVQLMRLSIRELTRPGAPRRERPIAACGVVLAVAIGWVTVESLLLLVFEQLGWLHTGAYRVKVHGVYFFWKAVGCTALAAVPCLLAIVARGGMDPVSRQWRKLQPLRNSLRQASPECSFDVQQDGVLRRKTTLQLHQTVVEIRDLILRLRPYAGDIPRDRWTDSSRRIPSPRPIATWRSWPCNWPTPPRSKRQDAPRNDSMQPACHVPGYNARGGNPRIGAAGQVVASRRGCNYCSNCAAWSARSSSGCGKIPRITVIAAHTAIAILLRMLGATT